MKLVLMLSCLIGYSLCQEPERCLSDSGCSSSLVCLQGQCTDPCASSPCPIKGASCKVVGHRPVCSCPPGHTNKGNTCVLETACQHKNKTYSEGEVLYDEGCTQKCECHQGGLLCEQTVCAPGLLPRGFLNPTNEPQCQERDHPAGDECCVLWVCADQAEPLDLEGAIDYEEFPLSRLSPIDLPEERDEDLGSDLTLERIGKDCENVICGNNALCDGQEGKCVCLSGYEGEPTDLAIGCKQQADEENIKLLQITSNSIQVQFPDIAGGNLMYVNTGLVGRKDPPWENAIILEGNEIFTLTGLEPGTEYTLRWKAPDKQYSDIKVSTASYEKAKPKVILTKRSHDSVQLSFDQFRPEGYSSGYVVSWKETTEGPDKEGNWDTRETQATGDPPSIQITGLKPSTSYIAKISIYKDYSNRLLGGSTEEIEFTTLAGCLHKSVYYPVGKFYEGCESACECASSGEVSCSDRCQLPFHPRGGFADDPLCVERTVDEQKCCVLVTCASAVEDDEDSPCQGVNCGPNAECKHEVLREELAETICVCKEGYKGDPDSTKGCSLAPSGGDEETSPTPPACLANNNTYYSRGETWFDGCDYQCSCSQSLEILCQPRCKILPENIDSECELLPDPVDSCCKVMACSDKSNTTTVVQPSLPIDGCIFKNTTYKQGERFYDGCIQHCQCMGFGDLVCLARCPPTNPEVGENCVTLPDLTDSCCSVTVCDKIEDNEDVEKIPELTTTLPEIATSTDDTDISVEETTTQSDDNSEVTTLVPVVETTTQDPDDEATTTETPETPRSKTPRILNNPEKILLGEFTTKWHGVQGSVYAVNESTLLIKNFSYDGAGPDAFFYVGDSAKPIQDGVIVPYPAQAAGEGGDPPVLGRFENQDVYLALPSTININNLRWISVWCRAFSANFGELIWGDKLTTAADNDPLNAADIDISPTDDEGPTAAENEIDDDSANKQGVSGCEMGGEVYGVGQQFYDKCDRFCVCQERFETICFDIECPSSFGQDVLSPNCVLWDNHDDFVPQAPACCPPVPTCISTGQCQYGNTTIENYANVPMELSGCEQRCHCQDSKIHCEEACYTLSATAPRWLSCDASRAGLVPNKDRPCCNMWDCLPAPLDTCTDLPSDLKGVSLRPYNATALVVEFSLPPALFNHKGHFKIKYSAAIGGLRDHSHWPVEIYPTADGLITAAADVSKVFGGLSPNTEYFVRPSIVLEDCGGELPVREIQAEITTARTLPVGPSRDPSIPLVVYLNMSLSADHVTSSTARVAWRHFEEEEKVLIDGLQLRYLILKQDTPISQVPLTSPFIHRDTNYFVFENLAPETTYEVELDIIPVPGSKTDLYSGLKLEFTTLPFTDIYDFKLNIQVAEVESNSVEVSWDGVPSPDQKFVNIYRVIYHANSENHIRDEASVFKISKIDSPKRMYITDLQSDLDYQIWLEAYLTNGKMTKSNVAEFRTGPAEVVRGAEPNINPRPVDDYYQSMVAVAIIATFAIVAFLIVLYFYMRRNVTYTHTINKERPHSSQSYLNSGFKEPNAAPGQSLEMATQNGVGKQNP